MSELTHEQMLQRYASPQQLTPSDQGRAGITHEQMIELMQRKGNDPRWSDWLRQVAQGATFGYADEIEASLFRDDKDDYETAVNRIRRDNDEYVKNNTLSAIGANVIGGLPTMLIPGAALGGAAKVAGSASKVGRALGAASKVMGTTAVPRGANATMHAFKEGGRLGAVYGSLYGSGGAEDGLENRLWGAGQGAAVGAIVGAPMSATLSALGRGGKVAVRRLLENADDTAGRRTAQVFNEDGVDAAAVKDTLFPVIDSGRNISTDKQRALLTRWADTNLEGLKPRALAQQYKTIADDIGVSPSTAKKYFEHFNANARGNRNVIDFVAEAGGPGAGRAMQGRTETAIARSHEGAATAAKRFQARQAQHQDRLIRAVEENSGGSGNAINRIRGMGDDLAAWAGDDYDAFRRARAVRVFPEAEKNTPSAQIIARLRQEKEFRNLEQDVRRIMRFDDRLNDVGDDVFSFDVLNEIQKTLRESSKINPTMDAQARRMATFYGKMRERLLTAMEGHFENVARPAGQPGGPVSFKTLRENYRRGIEAIKAAEAGRDSALSNSAKAREVFEDFAERAASGNASADEVNAYRATFGDEVIRAIEEKASHHNAAQRFVTPAMRQRFERAFGERGSELADLFERESNQIMRINEMTKGSPSARRILGTLGPEAEAEMAGNVATGNIPGFIQSVGRYFAGEMAEKEAAFFADIMSRMDEREVIKLLDQVAARQAALAAQANRANTASATGAAALSGYLANRNSVRGNADR